MKSLTLYINGQEAPLLVEKFPAGESLIRIENGTPGVPVQAVIDFEFKSNGDIFDLLLLTDAIRRKWPASGTTIALYMPYFPYARQDRVCNDGESLSAKVIADLINSQRYDSVECFDLHSSVSAALLNNMRQNELNELAAPVALMHSDAVLVSPDAGSNKKVLDFAKTFKFTTVVRADKERDLATGKILGTKVYSEPVGDKDFLILDDICDGGRTFIELAKALRPLTTGKIYLYVTHGIFSKGAGVFDGLIDGIYTANLMGEPHALVTEL